MYDLLLADIIGDVLSYFDHPAPALFGINRHWRAAAIAHFAQRTPAPQWLSANIRAALLCHSATALMAVAIPRPGRVIIGKLRNLCIGWKFWFSKKKSEASSLPPSDPDVVSTLVARYKRPGYDLNDSGHRFRIYIHPSIALIADAARIATTTRVHLIDNSVRLYYEGGAGIFSLYALYARAVAGCSWEAAAAIEHHCDLGAALRLFGVTQYVDWIRHQITYIRRDNAHVIARLRRRRGGCTSGTLILSDQKILAVAAAYNCWRVVRHLLESRNSLHACYLQRMLPVTLKQSQSRGFINTNKMIDDVISGKIKLRGW